MRRRIYVLALAALAAILFAPTAEAAPPVGEKDNGWSICEERYLVLYEEAHEEGFDVGRNVVDDGLNKPGFPAPSNDEACERADLLDSWLNPPVVTETAATTTSYAAPTGGAPLSAIAACESGGDYGAVDPSGTYGGAYQFDQPTWESVGGEGLPQDAPPEEQDARAAALYARSGSAPWPVCGQ